MPPKFRYRRVLMTHNAPTHVDTLIRRTGAGWQVATAIGVWPPEPPWADFAPNSAEMAHALNLAEAYRMAYERTDPNRLHIRKEFFSQYRALYRPSIGVMQIAHKDEFITRLPAHISISDPESVIAAYDLHRELWAMVMIWRTRGIKFLPTALPRSNNHEINCAEYLNFGLDEDGFGRCSESHADRRNHAERLVAS